MSPARIAGRGRAIRVILTLIAVSACLGAAAYAATRPPGPLRGLGESRPVPTPPQGEPGSPAGENEARPRAELIEYPEKDSAAAEVQFRFNVPPRAKRPDGEGVPGPPREAEATRRFQCRLDGGRWASCSSPHRLSGLAPGAHAFRVRALSRAERPGPAVAYSWQRPSPSSSVRQAEPAAALPFSIELRGELAELYPGHPPQQLPLVLSNPSSEPIEVTGLTVAVGDGTPSCSAENFALTQSSVSPATPLVVPGGASLELPSAGVSAPTIGMLNLPVNQDPCQGAEVPLVFSGEARG